jgi:hypothetical protein
LKHLQFKKECLMVIDTSRQQAIELTRNFCDAISIGGNESPDFYKMLWIVHWAIEQYGWAKTRDTLESIMLSPEFEPAGAPVLLRDTLLEQPAPEDALGTWFTKALQAN